MTSDQHLLLESITVHRDLAYVTNGHERQKLDLYVPDSKVALPLIIWIHGGAFMRGDKESDELPVAYLKHGFALASINYRLSQHDLFPAQIEDCKAAVRWLRAKSEQYNIDVNRIVAWGPSAGGHLSAMLGTTGHTKQFDVGEHLDQPSRVRAVIDYYGPTDFLQMDAQRLPEGMEHDPPDSPESLLVGGPIQKNPDKVAAANPITYVIPDAITSDVPSFLIVHGNRDPLVPYQQSILLIDALKAAACDVTFYTVEGGEHGRFTDPQVDLLTEAFLVRMFGSGE